MSGILANLGQRVTTWFGHGRPAMYAPVRMLERRRAPRLPSAINTTCELIGTETTTNAISDSLTARVRDASASGIRLTVNRPCSSGSLLHVMVPQSEVAPSTRLLACVVRSMPDGKENWSLGCSFIRDLDEGELLRLIRSGQTDDPGHDG